MCTISKQKCAVLIQYQEKNTWAHSRMAKDLFFKMNGLNARKDNFKSLKIFKNFRVFFYNTKPKILTFHHIYSARKLSTGLARAALTA